ncbi:hypothetical protein PHYBLDRAFT_148978 [Phycomyces blakesleeanus NRRL 1555(-)]|uniref:Uncharacterized protein n=1 Tax=Phycomyces blakesleeanus (strain ATCC 8743b / DSM 1359 / FGSC 10004 / NBRC 33097 / NRRL 1555) TaxID=763407 RepID=A0A162TN19_PHYB8|nr:hypothetical protein PHYBLDRAFT_148978 [Phycomyces blakesleeanus NRRL 1555(-)]OAD69792.1 hypothetical protein PHYBLDRAFT_148978 [Phycomyces blakesleeanus NRRL 1555(-)]|eukprot:XP_018287832.1 hypothetical protein PHYBLDRAFT_148978 [Phycomyces blakesleeanus NRRL 1555(-)]
MASSSAPSAGGGGGGSPSTEQGYFAYIINLLLIHKPREDRAKVNPRQQLMPARQLRRDRSRRIRGAINFLLFLIFVINLWCSSKQQHPDSLKLCT